MMLTRIVRGVIALLRSSGFMRPVPSTGRNVTRAPRHSRNRHGWRIAGCSTAVVTMWSPFSRSVKNTPLSARLLASLPPLVKTISSAWQLSSAATWPRVVSSAELAVVAAQCPLDGLP
jgi:hypothetical protein